MSRATQTIIIKAKDLATKPIRGVGGALSNLGRHISRLRYTFLGLGAALGGFGIAKEFIEANSQLEQMRIRMSSLLNSTKAGDQAIQWVRDFQKDNPVRTIQEYTESFEDLVAAGIDPTTGAMEALTAGAIKFALTADDVKGVTRALRQGLALPNFQKQELNQLAERIPGVMKRLADELGTTVGTLREQMKQGLVDSTDVAQGILRSLGENSKEIIGRASNSWQGLINNLRTSWFNLLTSIGEAGVFNDIKGAVANFTAFVNSNMDTIRESVVELWGLAKSLVTTIFNIGDGADFKIKPLLVMIGQLMGQMSQIFVLLKDAVQVALWGVLKIKNAFDNITARQEGFELFGLKGATTSGLTIELNRLNQLKKDYENLGSGPTLMQRLFGGGPAEVKYEVDTLLGGINGLNKRIQDMFALRQRMQGDLNPDALELDFGNMLDGLVQTNAKVNKVVEDFISNIKTMNFKDVKPEELINQLEELRSALKNNTIIGDLGSKNTQDKVVSGWRDALSKIRDDFEKSYGTMDLLGKQFTTGLNEALSRNFSNFFDQLIDGHIPRLRDAINSFLRDILRMMTDVFSKKLAMGFTEGIMSGIGGMFSGGTSPTSQSIGTSLNTGNQSIFGPSSGAMMAKASAPSAGMKVEVINQTGQPAQITSTRVTTDNGMQVLQLVLDGLQRNRGGFRDGMRGGLGIG